MKKFKILTSKGIRGEHNKVRGLGGKGNILAADRAQLGTPVTLGANKKQMGPWNWPPVPSTQS